MTATAFRFVLGALTLFLISSGLFAADETRVASGRIQAVDPAAHQVTIVTKSGANLTLRVDERSDLRLHQRPARLDQLQPGTEVRVRYAADTNRVIRLRNRLVTAGQVREQVQAALGSVASYTYDQKQELERRLRPLLDDLDDRIDELKAEARQGGAATREQYEEQIRKLRPLRDKVRDQLNRIDAATPDAWNDIKAGVGSAFRDLQQAIDRAGKHFQEGTEREKK